METVYDDIQIDTWIAGCNKVYRKLDESKEVDHILQKQHYLRPPQSLQTIVHQYMHQESDKQNTQNKPVA